MLSFWELMVHYWWMVVTLIVLVIIFFLKKMGQHFGGGAEEIEAQQAHKLVQQEQAILIDLAEEKVFNKSHIPGAINMPGITFINGTAKVEDITKPIILLPMKGLFPMPVVQFFCNEGVTKLYLFKGGLSEWEKAGLSVLEK